MGYRIGFDIGSTTIKAVVLDENNKICYKSYERHKAQVRQKALDKLVELKKYTKDATSLIVAQRIGTIMNADKIIVLDNGNCVGMGTHEELLKNCEVYKQIALSQLSKEELENGKRK